MFKKLQEKSKLLLTLGRYNYPTGSILLLWPCLWGLAYEVNSTNNLSWFIFLFLIGSFVMRGAGCCINDFFDQDFDKLVSRTTKRPLASGQISNIEALYFIFFQLLLGLWVILQFNMKAIFFGFLIMPLVFTYPLFKRVTYFPQLILGLIFNWGVLIAYLLENLELNIGIILLYFGGVFMTIGYDTIYGFQDLEEDKKIGVKSLSIILEKKPLLGISIIYFLSLIMFSISFFLNDGSILINFLAILAITICFVSQIIFLKRKYSLKKIFDSNVLIGGIIFIMIILQNYL